MVELYNPWQGLNNGLAGLGQTMMYQRQQERQEMMDRLALQEAARQGRLSDLQIAEAERMSRVKEEARNAFIAERDRGPQTLTSIAPRPQEGSLADLGRYRNMDYSSRAALSGSLESEMAAEGLTDSGAGFSLPTPPASPIVQAYNEGRVSSKTTQPQPYAKMAEVYAREGMAAEAANVINLDQMIAKQIGEVRASGGDPSKFYEAKAKLDQGKEMIATIAPLLKTPQGRAAANVLIAQYKELYGDSPIMQSLAVDSFQPMQGGKVAMAVPDEQGNIIGHYVYNPAKEEMEFHKGTNQEALLDKRFDQQQRLQADREARADARLEKSLSKQGEIHSRQTRNQSFALQKEIRNDKTIKQANDTSQKIRQLEETYADGKKTGNYTGSDQVMGYLINKVLDPDSVVMVSEFQRIAKSQGVPDRIVGNLQSLATGGIKLDDRSRDALINTMRVFNQAIQDRKAARIEEYSTDASALGIDPNAIVGTRGKDQSKSAGGQPGKGSPAAKGGNKINSLRSKYGIGAK